MLPIVAPGATGSTCQPSFRAFTADRAQAEPSTTSTARSPGGQHRVCAACTLTLGQSDSGPRPFVCAGAPHVAHAPCWLLVRPANGAHSAQLGPSAIQSPTKQCCMLAPSQPDPHQPQRQWAGLVWHECCIQLAPRTNALCCEQCLWCWVHPTQQTSFACYMPHAQSAQDSRGRSCSSMAGSGPQALCLRPLN